MQVRYFAWFDNQTERKEFIALLNNCSSDIDAINKVSVKYPDLSMLQIKAVVENFKKEINKQ